MKRSGNWIFAWLVAVALSPGVMAQTIPVSNVDELYTAVNNTANAGATLLLAPGTYALSASDSYGVPRPKGGRIEMQPDMSLQGVEGDRSAVVIDALDLPASSFPSTTNGVVTGPSAAVRLGLGHNALAWLTVRDAVAAQANIDSGLQPLDPGPAYIRVAHVISTGSVRGLNVLNFGRAASGQILEADIVDCYFLDNNLDLSEGVRMGNFQGARGSTVNVRMSGNVSSGQKTGRLIVNNRAIGSTVNVVSTGNRFSDNAGGTIIVGGLSSNNTRADGNAIKFEAHGDQFIGNAAESEFDHGGLVVLGTEDISNVGGGSNNTVNVSLWGARMLGNDTWDLAGIGARSLSEATAPLSQNNHVTIEIHGDASSRGKWQPVEYFVDSLPIGPDYGNSITVLRY